MAKTAGKKALVQVSGTPLTLTNEPTTDAGAHLVYQITNAAKRVLDPTASVTVKENGVVTSVAYTVNRLNGTITFQDSAPIFESMTVGDAPWHLVGTTTRTPLAFLCSDGATLDLIGDSDTGTVSTFARPIAFTGNGQKDLRFRIAQSSAYSGHQIVLSDDTAAAVRLQAVVDFTTATPSVSIVGGHGSVVSVTARSDGSWDVFCTAPAVVAANVNMLTIYPADGSLAPADVAQFYLGAIKAYDTTTGPRGAGVAVTVSGAYLPLTTALSCTDWTLNLVGANADVSEYGDTWVERLALTKDATGSVKSWRDSVDRTWETALIGGAPVVLSLYTNSAGNPDFLVWALLSKQQVQAALKNAQSQSIDWDGDADADHRVISAP